MPRIFYIISFFFVFSFSMTYCGGLSQKDTAQDEITEADKKDIETQSAEIEAQEPETLKIDDIKDLPSIYWGTWINEGELSQLEIKDDGTCELSQDNLEEKSLKITGKWVSSEKGIKITWEKPYMGKKVIEYRFEQTENQKLLFREIDGNEAMAFYQDL